LNEPALVSAEEESKLIFLTLFDDACHWFQVFAKFTLKGIVVIAILDQAEQFLALFILTPRRPHSPLKRFIF